MKVNVNLFKPNSGKWAYGGIVDVDERYSMWSDEHLQDLVDKQDFVTDGAFEDYVVVVTHREDYDTDPSKYFCQAMWPGYRFNGLRKREAR